MDRIKDDIIAYLGDDYNETQEPVLLAILNCSLKSVCNRVYPYGYTEEQKRIALNRYDNVIFKVATYLWDKQGAEGELSHNENGTSRQYESGDIPDSMLSEIVPMVGIF